MIEVADLTLRYARAQTDAVSGATFTVPRGRLTAIVGPNGSGKSTIVRALLGRLKPERGSISVDGTALDRYSRRTLARRIAVVPQREEAVFPLSVQEYVAMGRLPFQSPWRGLSSADVELIDLALARAGVRQFADRTIDGLSGGEWQRTRIARGLAQDCQSVVLDEPTTFLDIGHEMSVFELARGLVDEGRSVLVVSHQINLVARFADTMVLLHNGRVVAAGGPEDVMRGDLLEAVYEWPLVIARDPAVGSLTLVPLRSR
jgi:iron complex transport system ATP-binding protein